MINLKTDKQFIQKGYAKLNTNKFNKDGPKLALIQQKVSTSILNNTKECLDQCDSQIKCYISYFDENKKICKIYSKQSDTLDKKPYFNPTESVFVKLGMKKISLVY